MDVYRIASGADLENFVGGGKSKKILFALVIILYREGEGGGRPNILSISLAFRWLAMIT